MIASLDPQTLALLIVAAAAAGWIDAVVGGGGLVTIPALLIALPGVPSATVLGTNKFTAMWGTISASWTFLRRTKVPGKLLAVAVPLALVSSGAGAAAAAAIATEWMRPIVMVLLLAVGAWVVVRKDFGGGAAFTQPGRRQLVFGLAAAAAIAFYDGIFGPGTGTFLIMAFTALLTGDFLRSAAMAKVVNAATNLGALAVFAAGGHVLWLLGAVLAVANVAGAQLGVRTAIARGSGFVRIVLLVVVTGMVAKLGWDMVR